MTMADKEQRDGNCEVVGPSSSSASANANANANNTRSSSPSQPPPMHDVAQSDRIIEAVLYDHLVKSVCIDFAASMHQTIKTTGQYPNGSAVAAGVECSALETTPLEIASAADSASAAVAQSRQKLFPNLYSQKSAEEIIDTLQTYAVDLLNNNSNKQARKWTNGGIHDATSNNASSSRTTGDTLDSEDGENDDDDMDYDNDDDDNNIIMDGTSNNKKKKRKIGDENNDDDEDYQEVDDKDDDDEDANEQSIAGDKAANGAATRSDKQTTQIKDASGTLGETTNTSDATATTSTGSLMVDIWGNHPPKEPTNITCRCRLCGRHVSTSRFASHLDKCMGISTRPASQTKLK